MIDDTVVDDDGTVDDEVDSTDSSAVTETVDDDPQDDAVDDGTTLHSNDDDEKYDDDDVTGESTYDAAYGYDGRGGGALTDPDSTELDLLHRVFPDIPESQTLDTKAVATAIRGSTTGISLLDQFGTGELFDDESSAAASVAVLGIVLVILMGACLYVSFRQSMGVTPTHKNASSKQGKSSNTSFSKRRE